MGVKLSSLMIWLGGEPDLANTVVVKSEITGTPTGTKFLRDDYSWQTASGSVSDGDKGDITVSGSGTVWTLDLALNQIIVPTGSVNFNDQQAISFRIENRTSDPASPAVGQIWLRTDL